MAFEWDKAKAAANVKKHKVTFDEASTVFGDPLARIFDDPGIPPKSVGRSSSATQSLAVYFSSVSQNVKEN